MSEQEYLGQLSDYLTGRISNRQLESILKYYKEYFEEKGPDQAWRAEEELGTPDEAAARILSAMPGPADGTCGNPAAGPAAGSRRSSCSHPSGCLCC